MFIHSFFSLSVRELDALRGPINFYVFSMRRYPNLRVPEPEGLWYSDIGLSKILSVPLSFNRKYARRFLLLWNILPQYRGGTGIYWYSVAVRFFLSYILDQLCVTVCLVYRSVIVAFPASLSLARHVYIRGRRGNLFCTL